MQSPALTLASPLEYFPAGQGRQLLLEEAASAELYFPAKHSSQAVDAAEDSWYFPGAQLLHEDEA